MALEATWIYRTIEYTTAGRATANVHAETLKKVLSEITAHANQNQYRIVSAMTFPNVNVNNGAAWPDSVVLAVLMQRG